MSQCHCFLWICLYLCSIWFVMNSCWIVTMEWYLLHNQLIILGWVNTPYMSFFKVYFLFISLGRLHLLCSFNAMRCCIDQRSINPRLLKYRFLKRFAISWLRLISLTVNQPTDGKMIEKLVTLSLCQTGNLLSHSRTCVNATRIYPFSKSFFPHSSHWDYSQSWERNFLFSTPATRFLRTCHI